MSAKDPFGFTAAAEDAGGEGVDLSLFEPKTRPVDRRAADVASQVAQDAGFSRRVTPAKASQALTPPRSPKRRISIAQAVGREDRFPDSERAQVNVLAPVPVVLRWRELLKSRPGPAWEVLEEAMDAMEALAAQAERDASGGRRR
jgi:hypothetical protein